MYSPPRIADYYRAALEELRREVEAASDDYVMGVQEDQWIDYLVSKYSMTGIELDTSREPQMFEVEVEHRSRGYDIYSDRAGGTVVKSTQVRVGVPVVPSDTLREIWKHKLAPNSYSIVVYPEYDYDNHGGMIHTVVGVSAQEVKHAISQIQASVTKYNSSIDSENQQFRPQVVPIVKAKVQRVREKHSQLDSLASEVGISLRKRTEISKVVPTAPRVRAQVAPVVPPPSAKRSERPVLERDKFDAIFELIDNQCRQFERTPGAFNQLSEEGLRDVVLSSLNAVFEGAAGGETFQGIGKVDIHLRIAQGEVFVCELKVWGGPGSVQETIEQLRGRLTWRDGYGVAIILSRNAGFTDVLGASRETIPASTGFVGGSLRDRGANHFVARFSIPSDEARQVEIHVVVYNLYVQQPAKRQTRKT